VNVQAFDGNANVGVTWEAPTDDGGEPVTAYKVTATSSDAPTATKTITLAAPPATGFNIQGSTYQYLLGGLQNDHTYSVTVQAINAVGTGDPNPDDPPVTTHPTQDNSAFVFTNGGTQQTQSLPTGNDFQVEQQSFAPGTKGLGTIHECQNGDSNCGGADPATFCGGQACIGQPVITKLSDDATDRYIITLQYSKPLITGTGVSFTVYFLNPGDNLGTITLGKCNKNGPGPGDPPCVLKLNSQPALNPALKVQLSVPKDLTDPVSGTRH